MGKLLGDIFSMRFDLIIPLTSSIIAVLLAGLFFSIRFFTYRRNKRRYEKRRKKEREAAAKRLAEGMKLSETEKKDA